MERTVIILLYLHLIGHLSQAQGCTTIHVTSDEGADVGSRCVFPFITEGVVQNGCSTLDDSEDDPWCATSTDNEGNTAQWGYCGPTCKKHTTGTTPDPPKNLPICSGAALVIRIPGDLSQQKGQYRLDYKPPIGRPLANITFSSQQIKGNIDFACGLQGTKYDFCLYYSNTTISDWLTWTASITTAPAPPRNLNINVKSGKEAVVQWDPPSVGQHTGFKLKLIPLSETKKFIPNLIIPETSSQLGDLTPGATYEIRLYTVNENKESQAYINTNFTTKPNTPGRSI